MQSTFVIQDASRKEGTSEKGPNKGKPYDMLTLVVSEAPGHFRTNGEFEFSPSEEDRKRLGPPDKLPGRTIPLRIKNIKPFGAKIQLQGEVVWDQPAQK